MNMTFPEWMDDASMANPAVAKTRAVVCMACAVEGALKSGDREKVKWTLRALDLAVATLHDELGLPNFLEQLPNVPN